MLNHANITGCRGPYKRIHTYIRVRNITNILIIYSSYRCGDSLAELYTLLLMLATVATCVCVPARNCAIRSRFVQRMLFRHISIKNHHTHAWRIMIAHKNRLIKSCESELWCPGQKKQVYSTKSRCTICVATRIKRLQATNLLCRNERDALFIRFASKPACELLHIYEYYALVELQNFLTGDI